MIREGNEETYPDLITRLASYLEFDEERVKRLLRGIILPGTGENMNIYSALIRKFPISKEEQYFMRKMVLLK